jgi:hypothetical protein
LTNSTFKIVYNGPGYNSCLPAGRSAEWDGELVALALAIHCEKLACPTFGRALAERAILSNFISGVD